MVAGDDRRSDDELAAAASRGDRNALDALLRRHSKLVHGVCRRILDHPDDALDATQDALLAIARGIVRFDGRAQFTTWAYRIATNAALDESRRRARRPRPTEELPEPAVDGADDERVVAQIVVDDALARLPADFRAAVALRDLAGLDYAQIADVLDIPLGTVRSRIARGRAALADALGNPGAVTERPTSTSP